MQLTEMSATGFRTCVAVFRRPAGGLRWVVVPTIDYDEPPYMRKRPLDGWMDW